MTTCRQHKVRQSQTGFTLLEVLAATILLSILATGYYAVLVSNNVQTYQRTLARTTADQIYQIGNAAQLFSLSTATATTWADEGNNCENAINVMEAAGILPFDDSEQSLLFSDIPIPAADMPFTVGVSETRNLGRYYTECPFDAGLGNRPQFIIRYALPVVQRPFQGYIRAHLPRARDQNSTSPTAHRGLEVSFPLPAEIPAFAAGGGGVVGGPFLRLSGTESEDGPMTGDIDMEGNEIQDVEQITLSSGEILTPGIVASRYIRADNTSNGNRFARYQGCDPNGNTDGIIVDEVVHAIPVDVSHSGSAAITKFHVWVDGFEDNPINGGSAENFNFWYLHSNVYSITDAPNTPDRDSTNVVALVTIRCEVQLPVGTP